MQAQRQRQRTPVVDEPHCIKSSRYPPFATYTSRGTGEHTGQARDAHSRLARIIIARAALKKTEAARLRLRQHVGSLRALGADSARKTFPIN
jgi:hypothetical protein